MRLSCSRRSQRSFSFRKSVLESQGGLCGYCLNVLDMSDMELDHIIPVAYRVNNKKENIMAACKSCNRLKGSKVFETLQDARDYIIAKRGGRKNGLEKSRVFKMSKNIQTEKTTSNILQQDVSIPIPQRRKNESRKIDEIRGRKSREIKFLNSQILRCKNCNTEFKTKTWHHKFCTAECKNFFFEKERLLYREFYAKYKDKIND